MDRDFILLEQLWSFYWMGLEMDENMYNRCNKVVRKLRRTNYKLEFNEEEKIVILGLIEIFVTQIM